MSNYPAVAGGPLKAVVVTLNFLWKIRSNPVAGGPLKAVVVTVFLVGTQVHFFVAGGPLKAVVVTEKNNTVRIRPS